MSQRPVTAGRRVSFNSLSASTGSVDLNSPTRIPTNSASADPPIRPSFSGLLAHVHHLPSRQVWHQVKDSVICRPISINSFAVTNPAVPKSSDNLVRIVAISDTHGAHEQLGQLPAGDILIHAGDFTSEGKPEEIDRFCEWLGRQTQFAARIVVAGNHELSLDAATCDEVGVPADAIAQLEAKLKAVSIYAKHEMVEVCGLRVFASPHLTGTEGMAFNLNRRDEAYSKWAVASAHAPIDVIVSHGPALGHLDFIPGLGACGCEDLLDFIEAFAPTAHICGHVHRCRGATTNNRTIFVNVSSAVEAEDTGDEDNLFKMNPPIVIDVPRRGTPQHAAFAAALAVVPSADSMPGHPHVQLPSPPRA